jgi:hypothetical protein
MLKFNKESYTEFQGGYRTFVSFDPLAEFNDGVLIKYAECVPRIHCHKYHCSSCNHSIHEYILPQLFSAQDFQIYHFAR